jgi:hypothetical protein
VIDLAVGGDGIGAGHGGAASSSAEGISEGNAVVSVAATARGGSARQSNAAAGDASASAYGAGGTGTVTVSSSATGGLGPQRYITPAPPSSGDALALANAVGLGEVISSAHAETDPDTGSQESGGATAVARAHGRSGTALATARADGGYFGQLLVESTGAVAGATSVHAFSKIGGEPGAGLDPHAFNMGAMATGHPDAEVVGALLEDDPTVQAGFGEAARFLALVEMGAGSANGDAILFEASVCMNIEIHAILSEQLLVGFLDPEVSASGFDSLRFRIERDGSVVLDQSFGDAGEALGFFDDGLIDLGWLPDVVAVGVSEAVDLEFSFEVLASDPVGAFSLNFVLASTQVVPEPGTGWLLGSGLLGLAWIRVRSESRRARCQRLDRSAPEAQSGGQSVVVGGAPCARGSAQPRLSF